MHHSGVSAPRECERVPYVVIASAAKQSIFPRIEAWIASLSLSSGRALRGPVGSQ